MENAAKETVIIVHGTYAAPKSEGSQWYQSVAGEATDGFITKLNVALQERCSPAKCWAHCAPGEPGFYWSGANTWIARTQAAAQLANYVTKLQKAGWRCHIVA